MVYAKDFFDLQWQFADKVTAISGLPIGMEPTRWSRQTTAQTFFPCVALLDF
jgi:hypothetical protein